MEDIFKDFWINYEEDRYRKSLLVCLKPIHGPYSPIAGFRIRSMERHKYIYIEYHQEWDRFAPLIIEYIVNFYNIKDIQLVQE